MDCYIYAGAGIGFEFQTETFSYYPTYLVYLKLWFGAEATYSFNFLLQTQNAVTQPSTGVNNILLNGDPWDTNVDYKSKYWIPSTPQILPYDLVFYVAGIEVNLNFRIPLFAQWKLKTGGGGRAYAGSHFKARLTQGIVYMNPSHRNKCSMPGCVSTCSGWCSVDEKVWRQGGSGPAWSFKDPVELTLYLTPVFIIEVWGGTISGFFAVSSFKSISSFLPPLLSISGLLAG